MSVTSGDLPEERRAAESRSRKQRQTKLAGREQRPCDVLLDISGFLELRSGSAATAEFLLVLR